MSDKPFKQSKVFTFLRFFALGVATLLILLKWDDAPDNWPQWSLWQWMALGILSLTGLLLEAYLWWLPAQTLQQLSFSKAISNTLTFQYFHLFAPSGISEFSARFVQFKDKSLRKKSVELTALIQSSKWIARLLLAALGLSFLQLEEWKTWMALGSSAVLLSAVALLIILVKKPHYWIRWLNPKWESRVDRWLPQVRAGSFPIQWLSAVSLAKTLTYTLAFAFLIHPAEAPRTDVIWDNLTASWTFYFAASFLPSLGIAEGVIKAGAGVLFFTPWEISEYRVAGAAFLIWIFNKALPGLVGGLLSLFNFSHKS